MTDRFEHLKGIGTLPIVGATLRSVRSYYGYSQKEWGGLFRKPKDPASVSRLETGLKGPIPQRDDLLNLGKKSGMERRDLDEILIASGYLPTGFDEIATLINTDPNPLSFRRICTLAIRDVLDGKAPSSNTRAFQERVRARLSE